MRPIQIAEAVKSVQVMLQAALASSRSKAAVAKTLPKKKVRCLSIGFETRTWTRQRHRHSKHACKEHFHPALGPPAVQLPLPCPP